MATNLKDTLNDLVSHTYELGSVSLIKITGDDKSTSVSAVAEDRSAVIEAIFADAIPEFSGTFGLVNLSKLKILLNLQEYKEGANLSISRRDTGEPEGINFENAVGDFKNSYRFMSQEVVNEKLKTPKFRGVNWDVEFVPTVASITRLKMQAQANAEETNFQVKTEGGDLKFFFGDHSTHAGNFVFQAGVKGNLTHKWAWPVKTVISILDLTGDKVFKISNEGAAQITVDSGLAVYNFILPAQTI